MSKELNFIIYETELEKVLALLIEIEEMKRISMTFNQPSEEVLEEGSKEAQKEVSAEAADQKPAEEKVEAPVEEEKSESSASEAENTENESKS